MNTISGVLVKNLFGKEGPELIDYSDVRTKAKRADVKEYIAKVDELMDSVKKRKRPQVAPSVDTMYNDFTESKKTKPKVALLIEKKRKRPQLSDAAILQFLLMEMEENVYIDTEDLSNFMEDMTDDGSDFYSYIEVIDKIIEALKKNKKSITFGYYSLYGGNGSIIGLALDDISRNIDLTEKNHSYYEDDDGKEKIKSLLKKYFPMNDYSEDGPFVIPQSFKETTIIFDDLTKEKKELYIKKLSKIKELQEKENTPN